MNKRLLGKPGIEISEIAFSGIEIGLSFGIDVKSKDDMLTETETIRLLHLAMESGNGM